MSAGGSGYLTDLTVRLARGVGELSEATRARHLGFFLAQQRPDGGFAGREANSDLYYTGFGLRALAVLGALEGDVARRAAAFLTSRLSGQTPIVDFLSLIYGASLLELAAGIDVFGDTRADWRERVAAMLEELRRDDGGYAKSREGAASSTYHSFLVLICYELLGLSVPSPDRLVEFIKSQTRHDGGFVEIKPMRKSGTNPTAAAVGALRVLAALDDATRDGAVEFLAEMQNDEGGLKANTRIPIADLLSTFTGTLTLADLGALDQIDVAAARRYAESLALPEGGFLGAAWDQVADVEYSFYGLGTLAITLSQ
jgi:geranylgeranyl transferase type-2 subunit beta